MEEMVGFSRPPFQDFQLKSLDSKKGMCPLLCATLSGDVGMITHLCNAGADVNRPGCETWGLVSSSFIIAGANKPRIPSRSVESLFHLWFFVGEWSSQIRHGSLFPPRPLGNPEGNHRVGEGSGSLVPNHP